LVIDAEFYGGAIENNAAFIVVQPNFKIVWQNMVHSKITFHWSKQLAGILKAKLYPFTTNSIVLGLYSEDYRQSVG
jgi:hypothetical protein